MAKIDAITAKGWVAAFNGAQGAKLQANDSIKFDEKEVLSILAEPGCASLRVYFAQDPKNPAAKPTIILVGVDVNDKNITTNIVEYGMPSNAAL